jgi:hypothetical protein
VYVHRLSQTPSREVKTEIRERYDLRLAEPLKSLDAATIAAYESGELDLPVSVVFAYANLAGIPVEI